MRNTIYNLALALALASGMFGITVAGLMCYNEARGKVSMLVNSKQLDRLQDDLRGRPKDEELKMMIRKLDFELRREGFCRLQLSKNAARALIAALVLFLASAHFVRISRRSLPAPQAWGARNAAEEKRTVSLARYAVAGTFAILAAAAVVVSAQPVDLPERVPATSAETAPIVAGPTVPTAEEILQQWPSFRGPNGQGVAPKASVPFTWNAGDGTNIRWRTEVPLPGLSSPVVWGNSVFLTGADDRQSCVYRFNSETGALEWTAVVTLPGGIRPPKPEVGEETSLAAPTPVTDGQRVYALFPTGEIAAFDFSGKQVWARNIGPLENTYGYASSLAIYQDRLIVQIDREQPEDGKSKLLALNTKSGQTLWENKRDVAGSWASPVLADVNGQPQLMTCASPFVIAYNPIDGTEIWRNKCLESDVAPSPIMSGNMVIAVAPNTAIVALHPGAEQIAWKVEEGVPDAASPVSDGQRIYAITGEGQLTCYDSQSGKSVWTSGLEESFYTSPTIAGNALILISRKGNSWVIETGDAYKELGKGSLGEECCASPVPLGKRLLVRGKKNLFCIETK